MFTHHALFEKLGYSGSPSPEVLNAYARSTAELMVKGLFG